jgi:hypothetical protein
MIDPRFPIMLKPEWQNNKGRLKIRCYVVSRVGQRGLSPKAAPKLRKHNRIAL